MPLTRQQAPHPTSDAVTVPPRHGSSGSHVPVAIREPLERALNTDFSDVVLRERSPVPVAAGALALVRGLEVHLSPALGGLDRPLTRVALAHEFVHLTQQTHGIATRSLGGQLVADSPALERDADAATRSTATRPCAQRQETCDDAYSRFTH